MPFPLAIPLALSAIHSLVRLRGRLDTILSLGEAATGLPFLLPPAPPGTVPPVQALLDFFGQTERGRGILETSGLTQQFESFKKSAAAVVERDNLWEVYQQFVPQRPDPQSPPDDLRDLARWRNDEGLRMAYFTIKAQRFSRNTTVTRVLLAAADTLCEFGGENASLLLHNPKLQGAVGSLLNRFAGDADWDDESAETIFRRLLGASALALLDNRGVLPDHPLLGLLFDALADVRDSLGAEKGADVVLDIVSREGFQQLAGACLVHAAGSLPWEPDSVVLGPVLKTVLLEVGQNLTSILHDPAELTGVLEAAIGAAAGASQGVIAQQVGGKPLVAAVLSALTGEVRARADRGGLFKSIAAGRFLPSLYRVTLRAVAVHPEALQLSGLDAFVARLVAGFADELAQTGLDEVFTAETLRHLSVRTLEAAEERPEFLVDHPGVPAGILGALLEVSAAALRNGLTTEDLGELAERTVRAMGGPLMLFKSEENLRALITAAARTLIDPCLRGLVTSEERKGLFVVVLDSVASNPRLWSAFAEAEVATTLAGAVLRGLGVRQSGASAVVLVGPALVQVFSAVWRAVAAHGWLLLEGKVKPEALGELLEVMLPMVADALGRTLNGESVPPLFEQAVRGFLQAPFVLPDPVRARTLWAQIPPGSIVGKAILKSPLKSKRQAGSADPA